MFDYQKAVEYFQTSADVITSPYAAYAFYGLVAFWIARKICRSVMAVVSFMGKLAFGISPFFLGSVLMIGGLGTTGFGFGSMGPLVSVREDAKLINHESTPSQIEFVREALSKKEPPKMDVPGPITGMLIFSGFGILGIGFTVLVNSFDRKE